MFLGLNKLCVATGRTLLRRHGFRGGVSVAGLQIDAVDPSLS